MGIGSHSYLCGALSALDGPMQSKSQMNFFKETVDNYIIHLTEGLTSLGVRWNFHVIHEGLEVASGSGYYSSVGHARRKARNWIKEALGQPTDYGSRWTDHIAKPVQKVIDVSITENRKVARAVRLLTKELKKKYPLLKITEANAIRSLLMRGVEALEKESK